MIKCWTHFLATWRPGVARSGQSGIIARDGLPYTYAQFEHWYGATAETRWNAAAPMADDPSSKLLPLESSPCADNRRLEKGPRASNVVTPHAAASLSSGATHRTKDTLVYHLTPDLDNVVSPHAETLPGAASNHAMPDAVADCKALRHLRVAAGLLIRQWIP